MVTCKLTSPWHSPWFLAYLIHRAKRFLEWIVLSIVSFIIIVASVMLADIALTQFAHEAALVNNLVNDISVVPTYL